MDKINAQGQPTTTTAPETAADAAVSKSKSVKRLVIILVILAAGVFFTVSTARVTQSSDPGIVMVEEHQPFFPELIRGWKPFAPELAGTLHLKIPFLPERIGAWKGADAEVTPAERKILPPDTGFARKFYTHENGQQVYCSLVLEGIDVASIHRPQYCLEGQGWRLRTLPQLKMKLPNSNKTVAIARLIGTQDIEIPNQNLKGRQAMVFGYWFVSKDSTTANHSWRIVLTTLDRLFRNRNHRWAYFLLAIPVKPPQGNETIEEAEQKALDVMQRFIEDVYPVISNTEQKTASARWLMASRSRSILV